LNAGNIKKSDTTAPVVNVASTDEMARLARPEELKSIEQVTLTAPVSAGLVRDAKPVISDQNEHSRKHHNDGVYVDNGRHHHGTVIFGVGGGILLIVLLIVLI
jgi:hypothetical protein